jgi:hypothetical protein
LTVFNQNDFASVGNTTNSGKKINVWALKTHVDNGFADGPLDLAVNIFNSIEYYLYQYLNESGPSQISLFYD